MNTEGKWKLAEQLDTPSLCSTRLGSCYCETQIRTCQKGKIQRDPNSANSHQLPICTNSRLGIMHLYSENVSYRRRPLDGTAQSPYMKMKCLRTEVEDPTILLQTQICSVGRGKEGQMQSWNRLVLQILTRWSWMFLPGRDSEESSGHTTESTSCSDLRQKDLQRDIPFWKRLCLSYQDDAIIPDAPMRADPRHPLFRVHSRWATNRKMQSQNPLPNNT